MLFDQKIDESIRLKDGRRLGYSLMGDPVGTPLLFFHGTPGSRYCLSQDDLLAQQPGLCLVLPDRPGYGISDPKPNRTISAWADDVAELADALQLAEFHVSGSSGGGPYALACGIAMPNRIKNVLLFNSAAPWDRKDATKGMAFANRLGMWTSRYTPWLLRFLIRSSARSMIKHPEASVQSITNQLCESDKRLMEQPTYRDAIIREMQEGYRNGSAGHCSDSLLSFRPWGIDFESLNQPVHLWHGEEDTLSPVHNVRRMAGMIPNCHKTWIPGAGHLLIDDPEVVHGVCDVVLQNQS